jgi:hypothetical protein
MWKTNTAIKETPPEEATDESRKLVRRWGWQHMVRSLLGVLATIAFVYAVGGSAIVK